MILLKLVKLFYNNLHLLFNNKRYLLFNNKTYIIDSTLDNRYNLYKYKLIEAKASYYFYF